MIFFRYGKRSAIPKDPKQDSIIEKGESGAGHADLGELSAEERAELEGVSPVELGGNERFELEAWRKHVRDISKLAEMG